MGRRRSASDDTVAVIRELFMVAPWWICPIIAGMTYLVLACALPARFASNESLRGFGDLSRMIGPYLAGMILLMGASINLKKRRSAMMLDRQTGSETIAALSWREFEELLAAAFRRQGCAVLETGGGGADGGIDLILQGKGEKVAVQCKHWRSQKVGVTLIRELHGITRARASMADRAIFVTFGDYTPEARRFADENGIELIDRPKLLTMIDAVKRTGTAVPTPEADEAAPACPVCGGPMVLRTAQKGPNAGSRFWGTSLRPISHRRTADRRPRTGRVRREFCAGHVSRPRQSSRKLGRRFGGRLSTQK